jgi:hypothetical protein
VPRLYSENDSQIAKRLLLRFLKIHIGILSDFCPIISHLLLLPRHFSTAYCCMYPLLGNDREVSNYETAVTRQRSVKQQQINGVFCAVRDDML